MNLINRMTHDTSASTKVPTQIYPVETSLVAGDKFLGIPGATPDAQVPVFDLPSVLEKF